MLTAKQERETVTPAASRDRWQAFADWTAKGDRPDA